MSTAALSTLTRRLSAGQWTERQGLWVLERCSAEKGDQVPGHHVDGLWKRATQKLDTQAEDRMVHSDGRWVRRRGAVGGDALGAAAAGCPLGTHTKNPCKPRRGRFLRCWVLIDG